MTKKTYPVLNMTCAACATRVQKTLAKQPGVGSAIVNYANATVQVEYDAKLITPEQLKISVQNFGYDLVTDEKNTDVDDLRKKESKKLYLETTGAIALSIPLVVIGMFFMSMPYANEIMWVLATPIVLYFGRRFYIGAWKQLKHGTANMDTLVALSTGVAYIFSVFNTVYPEFWTSKGLEAHVYFEAAGVVIAFILLGKTLEDKAKGQTSSAIKKLIGLQPNTVTVLFDGIQKEVPLSNVRVGDEIVVKPGAKIAVDGVVVSGSSFIDESMISGEPLPVEKTAGHKVFAGTINQKGSFNFRAEKVGGDTLLAHIIQMVQEAQGSRAPVQQLVDKISAIFVPTVIIIALLSLAAWVVIGGTSEFTHGLLAMVTVLVIACPCALGLATPTAIMVGIGKGAEQGILIKDAESLELAKKMDSIIFDKTGTITEGKPAVTDIQWAENTTPQPEILASLEARSEHPLAAAVVDYIGSTTFKEIINFTSLTGMGAYGTIVGARYFIGNAKLLREHNIAIPEHLNQKAVQWTDNAKTVIWFANETNALAVIAIEDQIKDTSVEAIRQLQLSGIDVYMLTGDNPATAQKIAEKAGIQHFKAEMLPADKAEFIKELQAKGKTVGMVGDGINDSNALAQADISIAMGTGSDIAIDVAKMTIIKADLMKIINAISLSKATVKTIRMNLFWAFIYNMIGIPIAAGVLFPFNGFLLDPMIAGAAMAMSSVSVVTNSLLLKRRGSHLPDSNRRPNHYE
ncbi:MAG: copper-translocating P-type ATPase [Ignavibacteriaceae bacterium]|nr:MAG: copper-translocating P-type ATPase [Ignavibacteriaceae bacterium]MBW7874034.1 copper-translocating P-type ATPase [Ignavibacteria bacterium]